MQLSRIYLALKMEIKPARFPRLIGAARPRPWLDREGAIQPDLVSRVYDLVDVLGQKLPHRIGFRPTLDHSSCAVAELPNAEGDHLFRVHQGQKRRPFGLQAMKLRVEQEVFDAIRILGQ